MVLHGKKLEDHREEALESSFAEDRGLLQAPVLLLLTLIHERPRRLIHRSTWNKNSRKFISKILHSLTPVPLKTPVQAPCIAPPRYRL